MKMNKEAESGHKEHPHSPSQQKLRKGGNVDRKGGNVDGKSEGGKTGRGWFGNRHCWLPDTRTLKMVKKKKKVNRAMYMT